MSTLNCGKKTPPVLPPPWTTFIPEDDYHRAAASGAVVSSTMLKEFRLCPALYHAIVSGRAKKYESDAFRLGRAAHKLILEGEAAYRRHFVVGGPCNEKTGRSYGSNSRAFDDWLCDNGLDRRAVLTPSEAGNLLRIHAAVRRHPEASRLLGAGWPERSALAVVEGVDCQIRLDWLTPDGTAADLKTVKDIDRFERDARRFGYLNQFAFYRDIAREAGGGDLDMVAVVLEKKSPYRVGVWHFSAGTLEPYAVQNRQALAALKRCREAGRWPTGYETPRAFPLAGIPPLWLN